MQQGDRDFGSQAGEGSLSILERQKRAYAEALGRWDLDVHGRERSEQRWHWFGSGKEGVVAGMCELLDRHLARPRGRFQPAAIGCVPWFNHIGLARRLAAMPCCIVINKPRSRPSQAAQALHRSGAPVWTEWFPELRGLMPAQPGGSPRVVGPGDQMGSSLGPLRVYGHTPTGESLPLLHSKILVLGGTYEDDEYFTGVSFTPDLVWIGSANWTSEAERLHTESAVAVADHSFVKDSAAYVTRIIAESERVESFESTPDRTSRRPNSTTRRSPTTLPSSAVTGRTKQRITPTSETDYGISDDRGLVRRVPYPLSKDLKRRSHLTGGVLLFESCGIRRSWRFPWSPRADLLPKRLSARSRPPVAARARER